MVLHDALADVYVLQEFDHSSGTFRLVSVHANRVSAMIEAMQLFVECKNSRVLRRGSISWIEGEDGDLTAILGGDLHEVFCVIQGFDVRDLQTAVIQRVMANAAYADARKEFVELRDSA